jgi:cellulose synthase/poly-beta-1,6-N-acetylglucosamine synthase-like glycosyltransferase
LALIKNPVSIVIPMFNAERHIVGVLEALLSQDYEGDKEVIIVNDGSTDRSRDLLRKFEMERKIRVLDQPNQGAVAATNVGFMAASYDIICSVDSDVVLHNDWLRKIMEEFDDPVVGAVQGYYKTPQSISFWARMMGYDVEKRYDDIPGKQVTQVCTGNTAYRRAALDKIGLFDPAFVYGYDNDMSYRLQKAGYKLIFRRDALCDHYWKGDLTSYIKQQYWSAYGRMQLINKHKDKLTGDSVSGLRMILQVPLLLLVIGLAGTGALLSIFGTSGKLPFISAAAVLALLVIDRVSFAISIMRKQRDPSALLLPFVHLLRNGVWCFAMARWIGRALWKR